MVASFALLSTQRVNKNINSDRRDGEPKQNLARECLLTRGSTFEVRGAATNRLLPTQSAGIVRQNKFSCVFLTVWRMRPEIGSTIQSNFWFIKNRKRSVDEF